MYSINNSLEIDNDIEDNLFNDFYQEYNDNQEDTNSTNLKINNKSNFGTNLVPQFTNQIALHPTDINENNSNKSQKYNKSPKNKKNSKSNQNNKILGRKRKDCKEERSHDKYTKDNMVRKAKVLFKDSILEHINKKMEKKSLFVSINGKKYKVDKILDINPEKIVTIDILENRKLLKNKIRDLFSVDISDKYKNFPKNYNKIVIDTLYKDNKYKNITSILDINFLNCIKFFRKDDGIFGENEFSCLNGLEKSFEDLSNKLKKKNNEEDYIDMFIQLIEEFEDFFYDRIPKNKFNYLKKKHL